MAQSALPYNKGTLKATLSYSNLVLLVVALVTGTFFRISLLFLFPVGVLLVIFHFRLKMMAVTIIMLVLALLSTLLSFFDGFFWQYKLLSLFQIIPFMVLLFAVPDKSILKEKDLLPRFITLLVIIALINNAVGFVQYIRHPGDDSFMGIYSSFSISLYGLVILNTLLFAYFFSRFLESKNKPALFKGLFFLFCAVMGFYGAGLAAFLGAFILSFFRIRLKAIIKISLIAALSITAAYYTMAKLRPAALEYYEISVRRLLQVDKSESPRKIIAFQNYATYYPFHPKDLLFGSGPGTFNSRSAFMAGSPYQFRALPFLKSDSQPYPFKHLAYPLWNHTNTSTALYQDGFRNQPFSSMLSFLGEYGLLFTLAFLLAIYIYYKRICALAMQPEAKPSADKWLAKFTFLFLLFLLAIDNYAEYPEITLLLSTLLLFTHINLYTNRMTATNLESNPS